MPPATRAGAKTQLSTQHCLRATVACIATALLGWAVAAGRPYGAPSITERLRVVSSAPGACPASTRAWLHALHAGGGGGGLVTDLDKDRTSPATPGATSTITTAPILLHPRAVQPCLAPWAAAVERGDELPWWQGRPAVKSVDRGADGRPQAQRLCTLDGGHTDSTHAAGGTHQHPWSPPTLFTACAGNDDACFFEAVLSLSTPILWAHHAAALSQLVGYDVQAVYEVVVVGSADRGGPAPTAVHRRAASRRGGTHGAAADTAAPPCAPPPTPLLPPFNPAAAMRNLNALLDRHVAPTRHPREDELIEETYAPDSNTTTDHATTHHSISVWFWGGAHFSPSDPAFTDNFGDMSAVFAVRRALAVRMGVDQDFTRWPPPDPPGVAITSRGRATPTPYMTAVGSVLAVGTQRPGTKIVWGSGYIGADPRHDAHVDRGPIVWRGVRGPLSRALLLARHGVHTPVIKDPALLVPGLLPCCGGKLKTYDIVFALHTVDVDAFKASALYRTLASTHPSRIATVSNVNNFTAAVADLWSGAGIIASSLHAVIFAHAYGIPVLPVRVTDNVIGGDWKFQDHYFSLGHWEFGGRVALEGLDGLSLDALQARIDGHWQPRPADVDTSRMLAAFPMPRGLEGEAG